MPLPMMAGDPATMMNQPGMGAPPAPASNQPTPQMVDPKQQARGGVELISQLQTTVRAQLEGLARQFPGVAESANQAAQLFDRALQQIVRDIIATVQTPEPEAPPIVR